MSVQLSEKKIHKIKSPKKPIYRVLHDFSNNDLTKSNLFISKLKNIDISNCPHEPNRYEGMKSQQAQASLYRN